MSSSINDQRFQDYCRLIYQSNTGICRNCITMLTPEARIYLPPVVPKCSVVRLCDKKRVRY